MCSNRRPKPSMFFISDATTTAIYTLSLHDALPISYAEAMDRYGSDKPDIRFGMPIVDCTDIFRDTQFQVVARALGTPDRKSTRLNSSHVEISYAVFCLKKKKQSSMTTTSNGLPTAS